MGRIKQPNKAVCGSQAAVLPQLVLYSEYLIEASIMPATVFVCILR